VTPDAPLALRLRLAALPWADSLMGLTIAEWLSVAGMLSTLVFLEGLLGVDNALVLAMMVRHLPRSRQRRALRYGIVGAFAFRFIAVTLASGLMGFWPFEVGGGGYLLYLSTARLGGRKRLPDRPEKPGPERGLWGTVARIELTDLAFSIDSILAAIGIASGLPRHLHTAGLWGLTVMQWVVLLGGLLGIMAMRYVAGGFVVLLGRFPGLRASAGVLVAWIGLRLVGQGLHHALARGRGRLASGLRAVIPEPLDRVLELPGWLFWGGMVVIVGIGLLGTPGGQGRDPDGSETGEEPYGGATTGTARP
jgi:YkoY family integral membrane protein